MCVLIPLFRYFNGKDTGFRLDSLHTILQQEVLLQEDVELIELLDPSILSAEQAHRQEHGHLPTLCSLATPNIWYFLKASTLQLLTYRVFLEEIRARAPHCTGIINIHTVSIMMDVRLHQWQETACLK